MSPVLSLQELEHPLPDPESDAKRAEHIRILKRMKVEMVKSHAYCNCSPFGHEAITQEYAALEHAIRELEWLEMQRGQR